MKLLIIEDEEDLVDALALGLRRLGYAIDIANDGREGLELTFINEYDLIILDLNLPSIDGLDVLSEIRKSNDECKILILSARSDFSQRIKGLDMGANDYLVKPFDFGELVARIRALLRRSFSQKQVKLEHEGIVIDTASRNVYSKDNKKIELAPKEFAILEYLIMNKGRVISSEELIEHAWDSDNSMFSNAVKVHVSTLRKKLSGHLEKEIIKSVRGSGYIINEKEIEND